MSVRRAGQPGDQAHGERRHDGCACPGHGGDRCPAPPAACAPGGVNPDARRGGLVGQLTQRGSYPVIGVAHDPTSVLVSPAEDSASLSWVRALYAWLAAGAHLLLGRRDDLRPASQAALKDVDIADRGAFLWAEYCRPHMTQLDLTPRASP